MLLLALPAQKCGESKKATKLYKARLEVKALCMNYTFQLLEGEMDSSRVSSSWTDPTTGKSYSRAFGLANPCDFPPGIREGEEFYFSLDTALNRNCAVCMAYYPTPPKKLIIKVAAK